MALIEDLTVVSNLLICMAFVRSWCFLRIRRSASLNAFDISFSLALPFLYWLWKFQSNEINFGSNILKTFLCPKRGGMACNDSGIRCRGGCEEQGVAVHSYTENTLTE
jgi:hypothetical protein